MTRNDLTQRVYLTKLVSNDGIPNYDPFFTKSVRIVARPMFGKCAPLSVLFKAGGKPFNLGSRQSTYRVDDKVIQSMQPSNANKATNECNECNLCTCFDDANTI